MLKFSIGELYYSTVDELTEQFNTRLLGQAGTLTTAFGIFSKQAIENPSSVKDHIDTLVEFYVAGDNPDLEDAQAY